LASGRFSPEHSSLMKKDITKSSRTVLIKVESLDTDYDFRDKDLRSPNWFDAEKYPFIKFQSKRVIRKGSSIEAVGTTINQKDFGVKGDN
jgi:polyisoprenoid-binding protein YceI